MPQILVTSGSGEAVLLRERVNVSDFESAHFATQLVERLGWAVGDADEVDRPAGDSTHAPAGAQREVEDSRAHPSANVVTTAS